MKTPNIIKTDHGYNYCIDREKTAAYWAKHNIFNRLGVDAFGVRIKSGSCLTTHHIYINKRTICVGLIPLSYVIHRYLDDYLMWKDFDEYERWNLYLKKVYDYIYQIDTSINVNDLIKERNKLLKKVLTDKKNKVYLGYKNVAPYVKDALINILYDDDVKIMRRAFELTKDNNNIYQIYPYSFITFDKLLNKSNNNFEIESYIPIKKHIENIINNCKTIPFNIEEVISNRYRFIFENNSDNKILVDVTKGVNRYLDNHLDKLRYDWMKNVITKSGTSSDEYLLTDQSINILLYLHDKNIILFNLWEDVLNRCKNEDCIGEDIIMIIDTLKRLTFEFLEEEMNMDNNSILASDVVANINRNYSPSVFDEQDITHVYALEFVNRIMELKRQKRIKRRVELFKEELSKKYKDKEEDINNVNLDRKFIEKNLNNDYMGATFIDSPDIDYSFGSFVSKNSAVILSYIKRCNEGLYNSWRRFFVRLEKYIPNLYGNEEFKTLYFLDIHRRITYLRNKTLSFIKQGYRERKDMKISDYYKMVSILSNDDIRFYIRSINDIYDSKLLERVSIKRYGYLDHLESEYNNKLESLLNGNDSSKDIKINMSKRSSRFIYKNMNKDWMGLDLTFDNNENIDDEVLSDELFLTDDSRELLSIIKSKKKRLYNEIMDLLSRIPIDNPDNKPFGFDIRMDNLLYDAYCSLNKCRKEFNEKQEEIFVRLRDIVYK